MAPAARPVADRTRHDCGHRGGFVLKLRTGKREPRLSTSLGILAALDIGAGELVDIPEIVVVRGSRVGRAAERLIANPELADTILGEALLVLPGRPVKPADMEFDPPRQVVHDGRGTLTVRFEGEAFVRFLRLAF